MAKRNSETVQRTDENLKITIINISEVREDSPFLFHGCSKASLNGAQERTLAIKIIKIV